jgi:hypothetical protein
MASQVPEQHCESVAHMSPAGKHCGIPLDVLVLDTVMEPDEVLIEPPLPPEPPPRVWIRLQPWVRNIMPASIGDHRMEPPWDEGTRRRRTARRAS